ncbi:hypothetical protein Tco_1086547 [Tanacetum coccineum]
MESVGSHVSRVILFGAIHVIIPIIHVVPTEVPIVPVDPLVAPEVGAVYVISPAGVLDWWLIYLLILIPAPELPLVSPFLCSDDLEADSESEPAEQRPERHESIAVHDAMVSRIRQRPTILIHLNEAIPFGRPYRTHPNWPRKLLTARKRVRPFLARRLAWRRVSYRSSNRHSSPDFTSDSSSSGLSSDSSSDTFSGSPSDLLSDTSSVHSSGCDASGQTHSGPSTRVASSRSAPLSTPYPPTTSESSLNSSSEISLDLSSLSARLSHKRCSSPTTLVASFTHVSRSIAPTLFDLLPPRKRVRDSYSPKDSREEHMEIGTTDAEAVVNLGIGDGVGVDTKDGIGMGVEIAASDIREDKKEFEAEANAGGTMEIIIDPLVTGGISESTRGDVPDLEGTLYDIVHYMSEVPLNMITKFETAQRQLEAGQLMASGERAGLIDRIRRRSFDMTITRSEMTPKANEEFIAQRVDKALANYKATRAANALKAESQSQNSNDGDNENGRNGNGNHGDEGNNENGNLNENGRGAMLVAHVCTYQDFVKYQPLKFKGTEGVVGLTRWFEKMETVFHISNYPEVYQVNLMDQKLKGYAIRSAKNKRNFESNQRDNHAQQPPFMRQNVKGSNVARPIWLVLVIPEARGKAYAIGRGDANTRSNVVTGAFLLNNHYAYVLLDSGANRSFVSTTFSTLLDVIPDTLDVTPPNWVAAE